MNAQAYWQVFLETGAPEMYLLYNQARRMERAYASGDPGAGYEGNLLQ